MCRICQPKIFCRPPCHPHFLNWTLSASLVILIKFSNALRPSLAYSLADTFDTIGTFIGTGPRAGVFDHLDSEKMRSGKGFSSKMDRALFADGIATSMGALLGTSNVTSYIESAAGISVGGRHGADVGLYRSTAFYCVCLSLRSP